jgi:hypothetical protein
MNLYKLRGNVGWLFKLQPPAIHLDPQGRELPYLDEEWLLQEISPDGETLTIRDLRILGLLTPIGADAVHHFDTDRSRGARHGLLMLKQQMFIQGDRITFRLCFRPGERVNPLPLVEVERVPVSFDFIRTSGIQQKLEAAGFEVNGVIELRLAELEMKGWERVLENDRYGKPTMYFQADSRPGMNLIFIKRRKPAPPQRVQIPPPRDNERQG